MFEIVDGRTIDDRLRTDAGVTGILLAQPWAFGSGELMDKTHIQIDVHIKPFQNYFQILLGSLYLQWIHYYRLIIKLATLLAPCVY